MSDVIVPTQEQVCAEAQSIINEGVIGQGLDPTDARNQILVAGAAVVLAAVEAGLTPGDVLALIQYAGKFRDASGEQPQPENEARGYL